MASEEGCLWERPREQPREQQLPKHQKSNPKAIQGSTWRRGASAGRMKNLGNAKESTRRSAARLTRTVIFEKKSLIVGRVYQVILELRHYGANCRRLQFLKFEHSS